jgi:hypothetical protein
MPDAVQLTSDIFWESAAIAALIDAGLLLLIARLIRPERFFQIRLPVIVSAGIFWGVLGVVVVRSNWVGYYQYFYPQWMGTWGIYLFGPSIGMVLAIVFYWIVSRFRGHPVPVFFTLVGIEAFLEHLMGIYSFRIMDIPSFRGVNPLSVLVFSVPEYILYWCVILLLAILVYVGIRAASRNRVPR